MAFTTAIMQVDHGPDGVVEVDAAQLNSALARGFFGRILAKNEVWSVDAEGNH